MSWWIWLIVYVAGWLVATPLLLRVRMNAELDCVECDSYLANDNCHHHSSGGVRGSHRERNAGDAGISAARALAWPLIGFVLVVCWAGLMVGRGFKSFLFKVTPPTKHERQRIDQEQERERVACAAEIERLTAQVLTPAPVISGAVLPAARSQLDPKRYSNPRRY